FVHKDGSTEKGAMPHVEFDLDENEDMDNFRNNLANLFKLVYVIFGRDFKSALGDALAWSIIWVQIIYAFHVELFLYGSTIAGPCGMEQDTIEPLDLILFFNGNMTINEELSNGLNNYDFLSEY
ncbi:hypothetical protein ACJX0J_035087, partial [Zea mays]